MSERLMVWGFWAWMAVVLGLYLWQFRNLLKPALMLFGLA
jgi:hypothetical protein